jgi:phage replication-related protein YjqB (UPF0714/DUF867 family)
MTTTFAQLLRRDDVTEVSELRSARIGFMAFHGGTLEVMTDVIAAAAAERADASYYAVIQQHPDPVHLPSTRIGPNDSPVMARFLEHIDVVVTVHGFGRQGFFTSLLLGGRNRPLARHVGDHLRETLPAYDVRTDLATIPSELRGQHHRNPVNLPRGTGVQIELPPRVRGSSPLWWDWEGPGLVPHTERLIEGLAGAARAVVHRRRQGARRSTTQSPPSSR